MDVSEITELARKGDTDCVRACLLVPALKLSPKFKNANDVLKAAAHESILVDDYAVMQELKEQAEQLEPGIIKTIGEYSKEIKQIKETVVAPMKCQK